MLRPVRITPPTGDLVSLEIAKKNLSVDFADDDDVISGLIDAALSLLDGYQGWLGRCIVSQEWQLSFASWPDEFVRLSFPNIQSVVIEYDNAADVPETLDASGYRFGDDELGGFVQLTGGGEELSGEADWPVRIKFTAGYGAVADVPAAIKSAAIMLVCNWYENREGQGDMPQSVEAMISTHRWLSV